MKAATRSLIIFAVAFGGGCLGFFALGGNWVFFVYEAPGGGSGNGAEGQLWASLGALLGAALFAVVGFWLSRPSGFLAVPAKPGASGSARP